MRILITGVLCTGLLFSQETKKLSPTEAAVKTWAEAEALAARLLKETDQLAAEWQNRQVQVRDARLKQREMELILQSELCVKGQRIKINDGKPVCETPPKENKE